MTTTIEYPDHDHDENCDCEAEIAHSHKVDNLIDILTEDVPRFGLSEKGYLCQDNWTKEDVSDFYSDFLDIDLGKPTDSMNRIASDAYEKFLLMGIPKKEAESMAEGVRWLVEEQVKRAT